MMVGMGWVWPCTAIGGKFFKLNDGGFFVLGM